MKTLVVFFTCLIVPMTSFAEMVSCGKHDIERILVQGDREGIHAYENKLLVELSQNGTVITCSGKNYVYMDNTDPAYHGVLSAVLAAYASGRQIEVWVNSTVTADNIVEIAWVTLARR